MKTIIGLGLSLMITAGFMGCTSTSNNANMRNTNTNTGYVSNNSNMASPIPMGTTSPMGTADRNSNMMNGGSHMHNNMNSNMQSRPGMNTKANVNRY